jgi:hypothetical protein
LDGTDGDDNDNSNDNDNDNSNGNDNSDNNGDSDSDNSNNGSVPADKNWSVYMGNAVQSTDRHAPDLESSTTLQELMYGTREAQSGDEIFFVQFTVTDEHLYTKTQVLSGITIQDTLNDESAICMIEYDEGSSQPTEDEIFIKDNINGQKGFWDRSYASD